MMKLQFSPRKSAFFSVLAASAFMVGCGGSSGGGEPQERYVSGIVATGAALAGADVLIKGANGQEAMAVTDANGLFDADVTNLTPPLIFRAVLGETELFSYDEDGDGVANIHDLTGLALRLAAEQDDLAALFDSWVNRQVGANSIGSAVDVINEQLAALYNDAGVDGSFNFFTSSFSADHQGFDAVLDQVEDVVNCAAVDDSYSCQIEYADGSTTIITFNPPADGGNGEFTVPDGSTWRLIISGTVNGQPFSETIDISTDQVPLGESSGQVYAGDLSEAYTEGFQQACTGGFDGNVNVSEFTYTTSGSGEVGTKAVVSYAFSINGTCTVDGQGSFPMNITADFDYTWERIG